MFCFQGHDIHTIDDEELPHCITALVCHNNPLTRITRHAFNESANTLHAIDIQNHQLKLLPPALKDVISATSVTFNHGNITRIPKVGKILPNLQYLDLSFNRIDSLVNMSIFDTAPKLYQIELDHNSISDITPLFAMQGTYRLNVESNNICDISPPTTNVSNSLANSLLYLFMKGNCLSHIPDLTFMPILQVMEVSHNNITNSAKDTFPPSLILLYLNVNSLRWIPRSISDLGELRTLNLTMNKIQRLDTFVIPSSLQHLYVAHNNIKTIPSISVFNDSSALSTLDISGNPITSIDALAFSQLTRLQSLYMSSTSITRLPLAILQLTSLRYLNMEHNTQLACACTEKALSPFAKQLVILNGKCVGGSDIRYFLNVLAKQCP